MKELELNEIAVQSIQPRYKTLKECENSREINNHNNEILFNKNISEYKTIDRVYYEVNNTEVNSYCQLSKQLELNAINDYYLYKPGMFKIDMD